jgi:hypothetical protein
VLSSISATVRAMVCINRMPDTQQIMDGTTYRRLKASRYDLHDEIPRENPVSVMQHALMLMCIHPCKDTRTTARPTVVIFSVQCRLKKKGSSSIQGQARGRGSGTDAQDVYASPNSDAQAGSSLLSLNGCGGPRFDIRGRPYHAMYSLCLL